jgi:hypothetical protein
MNDKLDATVRENSYRRHSHDAWALQGPQHLNIRSQCRDDLVFAVVDKGKLMKLREIQFITQLFESYRIENSELYETAFRGLP